MGATLEETLAELDNESQTPEYSPGPVQPVPPPKPVVAPISGASTTKTTPKAQSGGGIGGIFSKRAQDERSAGVKRVADLASGTLAGIVRAPGQFVGGLMDTTGDAGRFILDNIDPQFLRKTTLAAGVIRGVDPTAAASLDSFNLSTFSRTQGASLADVMSARKTLGAIGNQGLNQFVAESTAAAVPAIATGGESLALRAALAGGTSAVAFNAPDLTGRAQNAALGAGLEVGGTYAFRALKKVGAIDAAKDALDRAFGTARTEKARFDAYQAEITGKPPEPLPQEATPPTRTGDTAPTPEQSLIDDANAALKEAGAATQVTPETLKLSPSGKVVVDDATAEAVKDTPYGRAFISQAAADLEPPTTIFKEEAADGSSRVVGSMANADLEAFQKAVSEYRANPDTIDLPQGSPQGQWSMAHLGSPYDAASVLRAVVDTIPAKGEAVSDAVKMQAARDLADHVGLSLDEAMKLGEGIRPGEGFIGMKAMQTVWKRFADEADRFTSGVDWATADEDLVTAARQAIHDLQMFSGVVQDAKSEAGDVLRSLALPDADTYLTSARLVDKGKIKVKPGDPTNPPPLPRTREELKQWLDLWNVLKDNPAGRMNFLRGIKVYPTGSFYLRTAFANAFTGAILSAPKTILMNVFGPAVLGGLRTVERTAGASVMAVNPLLNADARAEARAIAAQAPAAYAQTLHEVGESFRQAVEAWKQGASILERGSSPLDFNVHGIPEPMIKAAQADGRSPLPYHLGNMLNWFPRQVWRLHGATNEFAFHMSFMGEVRAKAMLEGVTQKLQGADLQRFIQQRMKDAVDETGTAVDREALDSAQRTTLVRGPDITYNKGVAAFEKLIQGWRRNIPETRYILPVFQVPANGLGEAIRRVPGVGFMLKETRAELSGELGSFRQAEAYGRMMLGAGFLAAGAILARTGQMTGGGPQDPADRRVWLMTHQPYSIKIGNEWVSYDRLEPVGTLLGIAAGYYDHSVYHGTDDPNAPLAAIGALAQYFKDKASMQAVSDILNFSGDPQNARTLVARLGKIPAGFIPAFMQSGRVALDKALTTKRAPWDYIKDALPGASRTLDPIRNIFGEAVHKPADTLAEQWLPFTLSPVSDSADDPVLSEIDRLYEQTGYTPGAISPSAGPNTHLDMRDVKLENGFSLYDALAKARGRVEIDGVTLRDAISELVQSPEYQDAPDGTGKVDDLDGGPKEYTKGGMMQKVFQDYTEAARKQVANDSPAAARALAVSKLKTLANPLLRPYPTKDLIAKPDLLQSLGIDPTPYEDKLKGNP